MRPRVLLALVSVLATLAACGTTPARPRPVAPVHNIVVPNGEYEVEFHSPWAGPVRGRMTFEALPDGFKANTRPGVAWDMVGGIEAVLGPVFMPFLFPKGMILVWSGTLPATDEQGRIIPGEGTIGVGDFASLRVRAQFLSADQPVTIRLRDGRAVGALTLRKADPAEPPPRPDYPALARRVGDLLREHLYDRNLLETPGFKSAWRGFLRNAEKARDDAEFLFGGIIAFRSNLNTSMPLLYPSPTPDLSRPIIDDLDDPARTWRVEHNDRTGLTTLRFYAFLDPADVDQAMTQALTHEPRGLIIDLRRCPGITPASLRLASLLLTDRADVGVVFLRDRHADAERDPLPPDTPSLGGTWSADAHARLESALDHAGMAALWVAPDHDASARYDGPVAVLASRRTSASAELLVHVLKTARRAAVVGDSTAGRPMLAREFDAGQGWTLLVPSIDHRPAEGARLNGRGVEPDRRAPRNAPAAAERLFLERLDAAHH